MKTLSPADVQPLSEIAERHGFGTEATLHMRDALIAGEGVMARFDHPEFGGIGLWVRGGDTMVSDLQNHDLKGWIDALCLDLLAYSMAATARPIGTHAGELR